MSKIIQIEWRSGIDTVGIVLCELTTGELRAYIGVPKTNDDEDIDARYIADYGAKLSFDEAVGFFPKIKRKNYALN